MALLHRPDFSALGQWHSYAINLDDRRFASDSFGVINCQPHALADVWGPGVMGGEAAADNWEASEL